MSKTTSLSDIPCGAEVNDFGTERYVNGLINFIENSSAPITIALQGEWGSGKTSLMNRLKRSLCDKDNASYIGIEVNTWEYSMMSSPEATVLNIITHLVKSLSKDDTDTRHTLNKFLKRTGNTIWRGTREAMKAIPVAGIAAAVATEALGVPNQIFDESSDGNKEDASLSDLKAALEKSVAAQICNGKKGVIVFVDDLDRLNPPLAVEILELLKNIFSLAHCIFVLAIDYEVVVKGLEPKFGKLTDKNEREFRSFFDKIIQVPFSLPVSSYRPMNFVLDSLTSIGYITEVEKADDRIRKPFQEIVENSVGKNPRSIKRLINTLSLLSCISKSGQDEDAEFINSREGRIANFVIVAMQVCYPKIYHMMALVPDFRRWDVALAQRLNIPLEVNDDIEVEWDDVLEAACSTDTYMTQHFNQVKRLLNLLLDKLAGYDNAEDDHFEANMRSIIDKSSVTGISETRQNIEADTTRLIKRLHKNVLNRIQQKRPDIKDIKPKRNTGNGGFRIGLPQGGTLDITFRTRVKPTKIACEIMLDTLVKRPSDMIGKSWDETLQNEVVSTMLSDFDKCVSPLLKDAYYFAGRTYPELGYYFKSFSEEMQYKYNNGLMDKQISTNVSYWVNMPSESLFNDKAVIDTISDVLIANYNLRVTAAKI